MDADGSAQPRGDGNIEGYVEESFEIQGHRPSLEGAFGRQGIPRHGYETRRHGREGMGGHEVC